MGRRALPKIAPDLDLSRHYLPLDEWPENKLVASWFPKTQPLEIEVGCGKGLFLHNAAFGTPEHNFVGIEIARKYARYAASKLARSQLANAVMFQGDGERLIHELVAENSVRAVHVYFPDPWWKKRHRKRRVLNESFARRVEQILEPGGCLHFWTDVKEYFDVSVELLRETTSLEGPHVVEEREAAHDMDYRTHFERRMRRLNLPIYRSRYVRRKTQ